MTQSKSGTSKPAKVLHFFSEGCSAAGFHSGRRTSRCNISDNENGTHASSELCGVYLARSLVHCAKDAAEKCYIFGVEKKWLHVRDVEIGAREEAFEVSVAGGSRAGLD